MASSSSSSTESSRSAELPRTWGLDLAPRTSRGKATDDHWNLYEPRRTGLSNGQKAVDDVMNAPDLLKRMQGTRKGDKYEMRVDLEEGTTWLPDPCRVERFSSPLPLVAISALPDSLRRLLLAVVDLHHDRTGRRANDVRVRVLRVDAFTFTDLRCDANEPLCVAGLTTLYNGGYHTRLYETQWYEEFKADPKLKASLIRREGLHWMHPGSALIFDAKMTHGTCDPIFRKRVSKRPLHGCAQKTGRFHRCGVEDTHVRCHHPRCRDGKHQCECPHWTLQIEVRCVRPHAKRRREEADAATEKAADIARSERAEERDAALEDNADGEDKGRGEPAQIKRAKISNLEPSDLSLMRDARDVVVCKQLAVKAANGDGPLFSFLSKVCALRRIYGVPNAEDYKRLSTDFYNVPGFLVGVLAALERAGVLKLDEGSAEGKPLMRWKSASKRGADGEPLCYRFTGDRIGSGDEPSADIVQ